MGLLDRALLASKKAKATEPGCDQSDRSGGDPHFASPSSATEATEVTAWRETLAAVLALTAEARSRRPSAFLDDLDRLAREACARGDLTELRDCEATARCVLSGLSPSDHQGGASG